VAGLQARGYTWDKWDVVGVNQYKDQKTYADLYKQSIERKEHCSAFIATGDATIDGQIVIGHNTWYPYNEDFTYYRT